jgi:hypothetical protein
MANEFKVKHGIKFPDNTVQTTAATGGGSSVSIGTTPPGSPSAGSFWWDSNVGQLRIYYNDGNTSQWVDVGTDNYIGTTGTRSSFTFGGTGTPIQGTAVTPYLRVMEATTCVDAALIAKTSPDFLGFEVVIQKSSNLSTWTDVVTLTLPEGDNVVTNTTTTSLAKGDILRLNITAGPSGAADWTATLNTLSI